MAEGDLGLKAVLETALDPKGFQEFEKSLVNVGAKAKVSGQGAAEAGGHFEKLGQRLPAGGFKILSDEMLRNAGISGNTRVLSNLLEEAFVGVAGSLKLTSTAMASATLGLTLLIPLIAAMASKNDEAADSTQDLAEDTDRTVAVLEKLAKTSGGLTKAQSDYLKILRQVQAEERKRAEETLQKQIETEEKATKSALGLWSATKLLVTGMIDHQIKGKEFVSLEERIFQASEKHRKEAELLKAKLDAMTEAHAHGAKNAEEYANKLLDARDAAKKLRDTQNDAVAKQVQAFIDQQAKAEDLARERARKQFLETQAAVAAGVKKNRDEAIAAANAYVRASQEANEAIVRDELATTRDLQRARRTRQRAFEAELEDRVDAFRKAKLSEAKITAFVEGEKARFAQQEADIERQVNANRAQSFIEGANQAVGILSTLFGESKGIQYAQTIINTAAAAVSAISPPNPPLPYSAPFLALALATGAAQLAVIAGATPGGGGGGKKAGFDDPLNDALAFRYGQKWAADFTRQVGEGFNRGMVGSRLGSVSNQSTTINRGTTIGTANFNGLLGTPDQALLALERKQIRVRRVEDRTRRRSVKTGSGA